jgi:hypothetical protein
MNTSGDFLADPLEQSARYDVIDDLHSFDTWRKWPATRLTAYVSLLLQRGAGDRRLRMEAHEKRYNAAVQRLDEFTKKAKDFHTRSVAFQKDLEKQVKKSSELLGEEG